MNKSKHTPGPWNIKRPNPEGFGNPMSLIIDKTGFGVAELFTCNNAEEQKANARLIAAAPELLAWTVELLKQVKQDNPNKMAGIIEHVENLISRAGGAE